jgi:hypothetical protein
MRRPAQSWTAAPAEGRKRADVPPRGRARERYRCRREHVGRAIVGAGVAPDEFHQAFAAALNEALGNGVGETVIDELFAAAAAAAHLIPGGAEAVESFLARRRLDARARRWAARVRALARRAGIRMRRLATPFRRIFQRAPHRRMRRVDRLRSRGPPDEPPPVAVHELGRRWRHTKPRAMLTVAGCGVNSVPLPKAFARSGSISVSVFTTAAKTSGPTRRSCQNFASSRPIDGLATSPAGTTSASTEGVES